MIPALDARGNLPPGSHLAAWQEIQERFGENEWRRTLLEGIARVARALRAAGCRHVWLDGSFVTDKEYPADFDLCYDLDSTDLDRLDPTLFDRARAKAAYGGDILPTHPALPFTDFFQQDRDGYAKGIVEIDLETFP